MGKTVHINIEDHDGAVAFQAQYPGGFDRDSPAHKLGAQLTKYMNTICQQLEEPTEEVIGSGLLDGHEITGIFHPEPGPEGLPDQLSGESLNN